MLVSLPSAYFNEYFSRKTFMSRLEMRHSTETVDHLLQVSSACKRTGYVSRPTSAPALLLRTCARQRQNWARACHICAGIGLNSRDRTRPGHICTGTGPTSAPGLGSPVPHLPRDWASVSRSGSVQICVPEDVCPRIMEGKLVVDVFTQVCFSLGSLGVAGLSANMGTHILMCVCGWVGGWVDGWVGGWVYIHIHRQIDR